MLDITHKNVRIDVYHTHIEIFPYVKGEFFELEKALSRWNQITKKHGRYEPVGYFIKDDVLYLPKGINIEILEEKFGCIATKNYTPNKAFKMSKQYSVLFPPRSKVQEESIDFLTASGDYASRNGYCQYTLNLETSAGKTYCAIASMTKLGMKTLILVNREYLSSHWKSEIMKFTNIPDEKIVRLDSDGIRKAIEAEIDADVYIVMHQSIQSFIRSGDIKDLNEFMKITGVGVKIYDECHEFTSSTFLIDCYTNVQKTFYLTATYGKSDKQENRIFKLMMSASCKYEDKGLEYVKKIHYLPVLYNGNIPMKFVINMKTPKGFSSYKYIDAALKEDPSKKILHALRYALSECMDRDGQVLIVSPKKESVIFIEDFVRKLINDSRSIGTIFSDNKPEVNLANQKCDIIVSTIKSCGTGFNPSNLQSIICMEPHTSKIMTHQLKGRLDRFPGDDTYFYDLIDKNIPYLDKVLDAHDKELSRVYLDKEDIYL